MKSASPSIFWLGPQKSMIRLEGSSGSGILTGLMPSMTQTASQTILTPMGGLASALTSFVSDCLMVSRAFVHQTKPRPVREDVGLARYWRNSK